ncbi:MAG: hypothetical protein APR63_02495 [Desulfuromonas sp. SDB]|nr:MAG: hypothetical protein APR63_02495 [Desulfuromonas sp. SDB]
MNDIKKQFCNFLKNNNLLLTAQRECILNYILSTSYHFDAEQLYVQMKSEDPSIGRATVFRTVKLLESSGLIRKIRLGKSKSYYELTVKKKHHEHLVCQNCGKIIEFIDSGLEERIIKIAKKNNFKINKHAVEIFGICEDCFKSTKNK